jgi:hypothetical protein
VDWREQFRRKPALGLGLAVGAGVLLAIVTTRPRRAASGDRPGRTTPARRGHLHDFWHTAQSTLIAAAAARAADLLGNFLLGRSGLPLKDRYDEGGDIQGEGDYRAARRYRHSAETYARTANIPRAARRAAPRNPAEAAEMAQAEAAGRSRAKE